MDIGVTNIRARSLLWISVVVRIIRHGHPHFYGHPSGYPIGYPSGYPHGQFSLGSLKTVITISRLLAIHCEWVSSKNCVSYQTFRSHISRMRVNETSSNLAKYSDYVDRSSVFLNKLQNLVPLVCPSCHKPRVIENFQYRCIIFSPNSSCSRVYARWIKLVQYSALPLIRHKRE